MKRYCIPFLGVIFLLASEGCHDDTPTTPTTPGTSSILLFTSTRDGNQEIYSSKLDGSGIARLTNNDGEDYNPRINPAKNRIGFVSNRTGTYQVFTMDLDGKNVVQVTTNGILGGQYGTSGGFMDWTADGRITYSKANKLMRCDANGANEVELYTVPTGRNISAIRCSPTGNKIAVLAMGPWAYDSEIILLNPDGTNATVLVQNEPGAMHLASFLPDGTRLSYMFDVSGHEESSGRQLDIHLFLIALDGSGKVDLSIGKPANSHDYGATFTSDGKTVYFMHEENGPGAVWDIWKMNIDGTNRTLLIQNAEGPICR